MLLSIYFTLIYTPFLLLLFCQIRFNYCFHFQGKRSPVLLRHGRPPKPLPRNIYTNVPPTGSRLYRSNSDCSSVVSYDLGNARNSHAVTRHSSIYFPPHSHRQRTDTGDTARSLGMAMDLGEGMHKGKISIVTD